MDDQEVKMSNKKWLAIVLLCTFLVLALVLVSISTRRTQPVDAQAVNVANQLYEVGHYREAAQMYEQFVSQGIIDSSVFYNLGNAYYKMGDLGKAILNYQQAAQLNPRDADVRANLELARRQVGVMVPAGAPGPLDSLVDWSRYWVTVDELAIIALGMWFSFSLFFITYRITRPGSLKTGLHYAIWATLLLVAISGFTLGARLYKDISLNEGVVVSPTVSVSSNPSAENVTGIQLPGGTAVNLIEVRGDWARMALPDRTIEGWIPVESVVPVATPVVSTGLTS